MVCTDKESFLEFLRLKIKSYGRGQTSKLAKVTGIDVSNLHKITDPGANPTLDTIFKLLNALELKLTI